MSRSVTARLAVTVDLPTPPLPEAIARICRMPAVEDTFSFTGGAGASSFSVTAILPANSGNASVTAAVTCRLMELANGSRRLRKARVMTASCPLAVICSTIPDETISSPVSGCTMPPSTDFILFSYSVIGVRFYCNNDTNITKLYSLRYESACPVYACEAVRLKRNDGIYSMRAENGRLTTRRYPFADAMREYMKHPLRTGDKRPAETRYAFAQRFGWGK
ncbi:unknown [Alistipes sp. CAG:157]|nr:unknown [Alistipes sp. CAG:157]